MFLKWAFAFLLLAIVAGYFGFGGLEGAAAGIAKVLFALFLVFLIGSLILAAGIFKGINRIRN